MRHALVALCCRRTARRAQRKFRPVAQLCPFHHRLFAFGALTLPRPGAHDFPDRANNKRNLPVNQVRILATSVVALMAFASSAQSAELIGRAVLPAATFAAGPTSGQFITTANGQPVPFVNKQPVQGLSGVVPGPIPGTYNFILDNGFGAKSNSADSLLRVFSFRPDFTTGQVVPVNAKSGKDSNFSRKDWYITLHDSKAHNNAGFKTVYMNTNYPNGAGNTPVDPAITSQHLLTGSDFDIEGIVRANDGSYYFGDEFGPFVIHTDKSGRLLNFLPVPAPNLTGIGSNPLIQSPDYPTPAPGSYLPPVSGPRNAQGSGGFEGFTINPAGTRIYTLLEKSLTGDSNPLRRFINVFDTATKSYTKDLFAYKVGDPDGNNAGINPASNSIGDMNMINDHQILVIERDQNQGPASRFKRVYLADLSVVDADGFVKKTLVADLMNLADPSSKGGNGTTGGVFTMPFVTIENVMAISADTILVANDNNYPFSSGRTPGQADDNEIVLIKLDTPLDVVCSNVNPVPCPVGKK